jgi:hypothetical protein
MRWKDRNGRIVHERFDDRGLEKNPPVLAEASRLESLERDCSGDFGRAGGRVQRCIPTEDFPRQHYEFVVTAGNKDSRGRAGLMPRASVGLGTTRWFAYTLALLADPWGQRRQDLVVSPKLHPGILPFLNPPEPSSRYATCRSFRGVGEGSE